MKLPNNAPAPYNNSTIKPKKENHSWTAPLRVFDKIYTVAITIAVIIITHAMTIARNANPHLFDLGFVLFTVSKELIRCYIL